MLANPFIQNQVLKPALLIDTEKGRTVMFKVRARQRSNQRFNPRRGWMLRLAIAGILFFVSCCQPAHADDTNVPDKLTLKQINAILSKNDAEFAPALQSASPVLDERTCQHLFLEYRLTGKMVDSQFLRNAANIASDPLVWLDQQLVPGQWSLESRTLLGDYLTALYSHHQNKIDALTILNTRLEKILIHCGEASAHLLARFNEYDLLHTIGETANHKLRSVAADLEHPDRYAALVALRRAYNESMFDGFDSRQAASDASNPKSSSRFFALRALILSGSTENFTAILDKGFPLKHRHKPTNDHQYAQELYQRVKNEKDPRIPEHFWDLSRACRTLADTSEPNSAQKLLEEAKAACALGAKEIEQGRLKGAKLYRFAQVDLHAERSAVHAAQFSHWKGLDPARAAREQQAALAELDRAFEASNVRLRYQAEADKMSDKKLDLTRMRARCHFTFENWQESLKDFQSLPFDYQSEQDLELKAVCYDKVGESLAAAELYQHILATKAARHQKFLGDSYLREVTDYDPIEGQKAFVHELISIFSKLVTLGQTEEVHKCRDAAAIIIDNEVIRMTNQ